MTGESKEVDTGSRIKASKPLYSPSWIDKLNDRVAQRPGPVWAYYLALWLVLFLSQTTVSWIEGAIDIGDFLLVHGFLAGVITFMLALFHYLDDRAGKAMHSLKPILTLSEPKYDEYLYRLTTLPGLRPLLAGLSLVILNLITELFGGPYHLALLDDYPVSATLLRIFYLIGWFVFGNFLYHTAHQLRLINHIYTNYTRINIIRVNQLYSFSNLSAFTAVCLALIVYGWQTVNPEISLSDPIVLAWILGIALFSLATFIWPQLGIHRIQVEEKERLIADVNSVYQDVTAELHQKIAEKELAEIANVNMAMINLEMEKATLEKIPTWPWDPEALRLLITALALPLGVWLLQLVLQSFLSS